MPTELTWDSKYNTDGTKKSPLRVELPFQTVETVNESAQERQCQLDMFSHGQTTDWRNRLFWADVTSKDARARQWCEDVRALTGTKWSYLKVPDKDFKKLKPASFDDLVSALQAGGPLFVIESILCQHSQERPPVPAAGAMPSTTPANGGAGTTRSASKIDEVVSVRM